MEKETMKKKAGFGTSWADEVEREEEEEAQNRRLEIEAESDSRRPNPFGAARPREVVLEEKGVDWRKLDQDLDHHNHSNLRKNKNPKENILAKQAKPRPQATSPLVPPLRYAPKNIAVLMEQIRRGRKDLSDSSSRDYSSSVRARDHHHLIINNVPMIPINCFREKPIALDQRLLVDQNMQRAHFSYAGGRRMSFAYGDQRINAGGITSNGGVELRDAIGTKRRLSAAQLGGCDQRRRGKQSRK